jgi:invasion protein IalB
VLRIEAGGQPATLRFTTLLGLHLPDALVALIGTDVERQIPWRTCTPDSGCLADAPLDSELLAALRRERSGTAAFTLVEGLSVRLGFSLIGFTAALRALDGAQ